MPHSTVNIKIDRDGGVVVYTGASEIGQGSDTMTAQIAAEVLGCSLSRVRVIAADTDLTPIDLGSYSSRVTFMARQCHVACGTRCQEADCSRCGEENGLRAGRSGLPRGLESYKKDECGRGSLPERSEEVRSRNDARQPS